MPVKYIYICIFELATVQSPISYYSSDGTFKMQIFMHEGRITLEITFGAIEGLKLTLDLVELHRQLSVIAQQKQQNLKSANFVGE